MFSLTALSLHCSIFSCPWSWCRSQTASSDRPDCSPRLSISPASVFRQVSEQRRWLSQTSSPQTPWCWSDSECWPGPVCRSAPGGLESPAVTGCGLAGEASSTSYSSSRLQLLPLRVAVCSVGELCWICAHVTVPCTIFGQNALHLFWAHTGVKVSRQPRLLSGEESEQTTRGLTLPSWWSVGMVVHDQYLCI